MDDDLVARNIEALERGLARDDPAFTRRIRCLYRAEVATVISVCLLLAGGTVLLATGLAIGSWAVWIAGVVAFLACFAVDEHHKCTVRRTR